MRMTLVVAGVLLASAAGPVEAQPKPAGGSTSAEIDAGLWNPTSAAVARDDLAALTAMYHPIAVLVDGSGTKPISQAIEGWGKDMATQKKAGTKSSVAFRFDTRQSNATTAFEAGIFRYTTTTKNGVASPSYVRFESLLVKTAGKWLIVMERQLAPVTEREWNALAK